MKQIVLIHVVFSTFLFSQIEIVNAARQSDYRDLKAIAQAMPNLQTIGNVLQVLEFEHSRESVRAVRETLEKDGINQDSKLPAIHFKNTNIEVGGKTFKVLGDSPAKISYMGRVWTWDRSKSLDQNFHTLREIISAKSSAIRLLDHTTRAALDGQAIGSDLKGTVSTGVAITLAAVMASVSLPLWATAGTAVVVGYGITRLASWAMSHDTYTCTKDGFKFADDVEVIGNSEKIEKVMRKPGRYSKPEQVDIHREDAHQIREVLEMCANDPAAVSRLNIKIRTGVAKYAAANPEKLIPVRQ